MSSSAPAAAAAPDRGPRLNPYFRRRARTILWPIRETRRALRVLAAWRARARAYAEVVDDCEPDVIILPEEIVGMFTPLMIKAGVPAEFVENKQVQGLLGLLLPLLLNQFGDKIPGLQNMKALPALSQQQLIMGVADVIGVSMSQLLGIGLEVVGSLQEGVGSSDDKLKAAKDLLDSAEVNQEPAAKTGPQAV